MFAQHRFQTVGAKHLSFCVFGVDDSVRKENQQITWLGVNQMFVILRVGEKSQWESFCRNCSEAKLGTWRAAVNLRVAMLFATFPVLPEYRDVDRLNGSGIR